LVRTKTIITFAERKFNLRGTTSGRIPPIFGGKLKGGLPADKKAVVISVPHTSIMDFIWGKLTFISQGVPTYILMKKEFFFFPLGPAERKFNLRGTTSGRIPPHGINLIMK